MSRSLKTAHRILLAAGAAYFLLVCFQENLWFDESFTVALLRHPLPELLRISLADVHPPLYYLLLKPFFDLSGGSIPVLRMFSALGAWLLMGLGYTHIRKDFGEKTGFWFSLVTLLTPAVLEYANQIRMYTWSALFVALGAIYARRFYSEPTRKNGILLSLSFVAAAGCHHYGLAAAGMTNLFLFGALLCKKKRILPYLGCAALQVGLYLPVLTFFLRQTHQVTTDGFWISFHYPDILLDTLAFPWFPNEEGAEGIALRLMWASGCLIFFAFLFAGLWFWRKKGRCKEGLFALCIPAATVAVCLLVSLNVPVFHIRYTFPLCGFFLFFLAQILAQISKKSLQLTLTTCLAVLTLGNGTYLLWMLYDPDRNAPFDYINTNVQAGEVLLYDAYISDVQFVLRCPQVPQIFYDRTGYDLANIDAAFAPTLTKIQSLDMFKDYSGTLWVVLNDDRLLEDLQALADVTVLSESDTMVVRYKANIYRFAHIRIGE